MNQELLVELKKNIDELNENGFLDNAQLFLFGMNTPGDRVIQYVNSLGYKVEGILDNNRLNQGKTLLGISVFSPDVLLEREKESIRILICSRYYLEMKEQLIKMDCVNEKYIFRLLTYGQNSSVGSSIENFDIEKEKVLQGLRWINDIFNKYKNAIFFAVPVAANGDVYLSSVLAAHYQKKNPSKEFVVICVGNLCAQIVKLLDLSVEKVTQTQMEQIVSCIGFLGSDRVGIKVLYPRTWHFSILYRLAGYKKINYFQLLAASAGYGGFYKEMGRIGFSERFMDLRPLLSADSIILSPYANSLPNFPISFWEKIAEGLLERGYVVYTNSGGEMEPVIKNTQKLFLKMGDMVCAMDQIKAFISIRNGLCDVLAQCVCQKIILYPEKGMEQGTVLDCYSLNGMGLCNDAEEIIYTEDNEQEVLEKIFHVID